jgi:hypothetical protein
MTRQVRPRFRRIHPAVWFPAVSAYVGQKLASNSTDASYPPKVTDRVVGQASACAGLQPRRTLRRPGEAGLQTEVCPTAARPLSSAWVARPATHGNESWMTFERVIAEPAKGTGTDFRSACSSRGPALSQAGNALALQRSDGKARIPRSHRPPGGRPTAGGTRLRARRGSSVPDQPLSRKSLNLKRIAAAAWPI